MMGSQILQAHVEFWAVASIRRLCENARQIQAANWSAVSSWRPTPTGFSGGPDGAVSARTGCRSRPGLMSAPALAGTAAEFGLSPGTLRRRARRSIDALASAFRSGRFAPSI